MNRPLPVELARVTTGATLMNTKDIAKRFGLKHRTLEDWRQRRVGPPYLKLGGAVRYDPVQVAAWLKQNEVAA
ncbi:helix-turn-helix transcriptional regulator [Microbacterium paludicola]